METFSRVIRNNSAWRDTVSGTLQASELPIRLLEDGPRERLLATVLEGRGNAHKWRCSRKARAPVENPVRR